MKEIKKMKAGENLVGLQIFASQYCIDMCVVIRMHTNLYMSGK